MARRRVSPTARHRRLRSELTRLREQAGLTQGQAAERADVAEITLFRWEKGVTLPRAADVAFLLDVYGVHGQQREILVQAAKGARGQDWFLSHREALKPGFDTYLALESEAAAIRTYEDELVPGLLQTEAYTRTVIAALAMNEVPDIDEKVTVRRERQAQLSGPDAIRLTAVLNEAVIRTVVGGPEVMGEQLNWLVQTSSLPNVTLQVMPFEAGAHAGMDGSFVVLEFPEPDPAVVYLEQAASGLVLEDDADVRRYTLRFGNLTSKALSPSRSRAFLAEVAQQL